MILLLFILWVIFNGKITTEIVVVGIIVSLAVTVFSQKFFYREPKTTKHIIKEDLMTVAYIGVLIIEILKANFAVLTIMLSKEIYKVHCLDKSFAPGMDDSIFVKMLRKMEEL